MQQTNIQSIDLAGKARIKGVVSRIIFSKEEDFFHIFSVFTDKKENITVKGGSQFLREGDTVDVIGAYEDTRYGKQINAEFVDNLSCRADTSSKEGLIAFLSSDIIKGVGKKLAERIVEKFGDDTLDIIESEPERLAELKGVSKSKATGIHEQAREQIAIAKLMARLGKYGMTAKMMARIHEHFSEKNMDAIGEIERNPYCLCDVDGIAFKMADRYAQAAGIPIDSPHRLREGVKFVLQDAVMTGGSCGMQMTALVTTAAITLDVGPEMASLGLKQLLDSGQVIREGDVCYDKMAWHVEEKIAKTIADLVKGFKPPKMDVMPLILEAEKKADKVLSEKQRDAVMMAATNGVSVITGQPGTGKTTIMEILLSVLITMGEARPKIGIMAPTGKAANRLGEKCGGATTQHRALGAQGPGMFIHNESDPLDVSTACIDEFSMDDIFLANATFRAITIGTRLVLVGDVNQLPSVGPGQVLKDFIDSEVIPVTRLTEPRRYGDGAGINMAVAAINAGIVPVADEKNEFVMITSEKPAEMIIRGVKRMLEMGESQDSIQVLAPMRNGACGVTALNALLQPILNPIAASGAVFVERFEAKFFQGDRVMQLKNDYHYNVFNGDIGKVIKVNVEAGSVTAKFDNGAEVEYTGSRLDQITLSYACTVHKFQGSEARNVLMPISMSHYTMLKRNLINTGVSRAKYRFVMVVEPSKGRAMAALQLGLSRTDTDNRISRLAGLLKKHLGKK